MTLDDFFKYKQKNAWLKLEEPAIMYIRDAKRVIHGQMMRTLDLATIEVNEEMRGQGVFKGLLAKLEKMVIEQGFDGLYVENIMEPKLVEYLKTQGYTQTAHSDYCPCLVKKSCDMVQDKKLKQKI